MSSLMFFVNMLKSQWLCFFVNPLSSFAFAFVLV